MESTKKTTHSPGMGEGDRSVHVGHDKASKGAGRLKEFGDRAVIACCLTHLMEETRWSEFSDILSTTLMYNWDKYVHMRLKHAIKPGEIYFWGEPITLGIVSKSIREKAHLVLIVPTTETVLKWMDASYERLADYFNEVCPEETGLVRISLPSWNEQDGDTEVISQVRDLRTLADCVRKSWFVMPKVTSKVFLQRLPNNSTVIMSDGRVLIESLTIVESIESVVDAIRSWRPKEVSNG